jgi:hypothetical protein
LLGRKVDAVANVNVGGGFLNYLERAATKPSCSSSRSSGSSPARAPEDKAKAEEWKLASRATAADCSTAAALA